MDETVCFYQSLGFVTEYQTINEKADEKVAFLTLGNLTMEVYESKKAVMAVGAIDHAEGTLERLRYNLGGDRPSQTTRLTLSAGL